MLKVFVGRPDDELYDVGGYFDYMLDDSIVQDEFSKRVIKKIDNSEVLGNDAIKSPVLGIISKRRISGGSKAVIVVKNTDEHISLTAMGDNCFGMLQEAADLRDKENSGDILVYTDILRPLFKYGVREFMLVNNNTLITNNRQWINEYINVGGK
jgi:hypothetical protein